MSRRPEHSSAATNSGPMGVRARRGPGSRKAQGSLRAPMGRLLRYLGSRIALRSSVAVRAGARPWPPPSSWLVRPKILGNATTELTERHS